MISEDHQKHRTIYEGKIETQRWRHCCRDLVIKFKNTTRCIYFNLLIILQVCENEKNVFETRYT